MFNKKFLIILTLSLFIIISSVSAEEIISDTNVEVDSSVEDQFSDDGFSSEIIESENLNLEESDSKNIKADLISESKGKLSDSASRVSISDITAYENEDAIVKINANIISDEEYMLYFIKVYDSNDKHVNEHVDFIQTGNHITPVNLGRFNPGNYKLIFECGDLTCTSNMKILNHKVVAKITSPNYSSFYKSGKTINIKTVDDFNYKPISLKVKLSFKDSDGNIKTFYVTTNSSGFAKFKVNLAVDTYKLTITSADSRIKSNKEVSTVKVWKAPISIKLNKVRTSPKTYFYLKATIKDKNSKLVNQGKVKFKLAKHTYKAKVKNGIAKVKVKFKSKLNTVCKATFTAKNYVSKTAKAKVVVKPRVIRIGQYSCTISESQWKKIQKAKYDYRVKYKESYDTHKYRTVKYYVYKTKKYSVYKNKLYIHTWYDKNNVMQQELFQSAEYAPYGYTYLKSKIVSKIGDTKQYLVYKKTVTKKIKVTKYLKCKVYIDIYPRPFHGDAFAIANTHSKKLASFDEDFNYQSKEKWI